MSQPEGEERAERRKRDCAAETPTPYAYRVMVKSIGIEAPLWTWQIDLEEGNGVLDWGQAHSRRKAVRQVTRRMKQHSRRTRKQREAHWWLDDPA